MTNEGSQTTSHAPRTKDQGRDKLSLRTKLLFSTGDLSTSIPLAIVMFFQLYFLTDVAGLPPGLAAWAVGIGRIWDAVNDPLFGLVSDRIRSRWGRRRVLLLFGAVPLGVSFAMMWLVPPWGPLALTVYYTLAFILFDTIFTAVHVGYNALTPEMTPDYDERSSLNGYRMVFSIAGTLGAIILATVLGWLINDSRAAVCAHWPDLGPDRHLSPPHRLCRDPRASVRRATRATARTGGAEGNVAAIGPFRLVMGLYLLSWTAASILAAALVYFANYYLGVPDQANYFVLVAQGSAILFIPLVGLAGPPAGQAPGLYPRHADLDRCTVWHLGLSPDQVTLAYVLAALAGLGIATAYVIPWSMVPDVIEYDARQAPASGERAPFTPLPPSFRNWPPAWPSGPWVWPWPSPSTLRPARENPYPSSQPKQCTAIRSVHGARARRAAGSGHLFALALPHHPRAAPGVARGASNPGSLELYPWFAEVSDQGGTGSIKDSRLSEVEGTGDLMPELSIDTLAIHAGERTRPDHGRPYPCPAYVDRLPTAGLWSQALRRPDHGLIPAPLRLHALEQPHDCERWRKRLRLWNRRPLESQEGR